MEMDDGCGDGAESGLITKVESKDHLKHLAVMLLLLYYFFPNKTHKMRLKIYGLSFTILHFFSVYEMQSICCS